MRLAREGEIGVLLKDRAAQGRNLGKQVHVDKTCPTCKQWVCTALETLYGAPSPLIKAFFGPGYLEVIPPGSEVCIAKDTVFAKDDPDALPMDPVERALDREITLFEAAEHFDTKEGL